MKTKNRIFAYAIIVAALILSVAQSCKKELMIPILTTWISTTLTQTTLLCGGTVDSDGALSDLGVCWSLHKSPTVADNKTRAATIDTSMNRISFECTITGLPPKGTFYIRAYGTNSAGTGYGSETSIIRH